MKKLIILILIITHLISGCTKQSSFNTEPIVDNPSVKINLEWINKNIFFENSRSNVFKYPYNWVNDKLAKFYGKEYANLPYYINGYRVQKNEFPHDKIDDNTWIIKSKIDNLNYMFVTTLPINIEFANSESFIEVWGTLTGDIFQSTYTSLAADNNYPPLIEPYIIKIDGKLVYENNLFFDDFTEDSVLSIYDKADSYINTNNIELACELLINILDYPEASKLFEVHKEKYVELLLSKINDVSNPFLKNYNLELMESIVYRLKEINSLSLEEFTMIDKYIIEVKELRTLKLEFDREFYIWGIKGYHPDIAKENLDKFLSMKQDILDKANQIYKTNIFSYQEISDIAKSEQFNVFMIDAKIDKDSNNLYVKYNYPNNWQEVYLINVVPWEFDYVDNNKEQFLSIFNYESLENGIIFREKLDVKRYIEAHLYNE